jgi:Asp-tRNA(Asn)/Glu-tRNA(Gln) amidotransferase A subunit family amidase
VPAPLRGPEPAKPVRVGLVVDPAGHGTANQVREGVRKAARALEGCVAATVRGLRMTLAVNALGLPAVALPVGVGDGLPQSVQVIGPRYREGLCLDAAAALEERVGIITPIDPRWQ